MNEESGITRILNGITHTLNIANKAIPVYTQAKPLVKKGIDTYNNIKHIKLVGFLSFIDERQQIQQKRYVDNLEYL